MDVYKVKPIKEKKNIEVTVPGSKSITNRALMLAAMSEGVCTLNGVLFSDDSRAFLDCLINLGFEVTVDETKCKVVIKGENGTIPNKKASINVRSAGTAARFMTVFLAVSGGDYVLNSSEQMKKRPMSQLLENLKDKGVKIKYLENEGHFPFEIHSEGIKSGTISIDTTTSSQYASALLMASVINGMKIKLTGKRVEGAYIKITLKMLEQFGIKFNKQEDNVYNIPKQNFSLATYSIEPDMSAACYFYAMAVILKVKSVVREIHKDSMQGDIKFIWALEQLGCKVTDCDIGIEVDATQVSDYNGIEIDMSDFSDQALTMAVIAAFAKSSSTIKNIGHIRGQESDRVMVIVNELEKIGCSAYINEMDKTTDIIINPKKLHGAQIDTYEDHRVAMSFALVGLAVDGIIIKNPLCCRKTFENYFDILTDIAG
jgi:3-phosphoshikimate 1-carboxyvinyltransferase